MWEAVYRNAADQPLLSGGSVLDGSDLDPQNMLVAGPIPTHSADDVMITEAVPIDVDRQVAQGDGSSSDARSGWSNSTDGYARCCGSLCVSQAAEQFPGVERIPPAASPALVPLGFGREASDS